jgi:hypothetical protein
MWVRAGTAEKTDSMPKHTARLPWAATERAGWPTSRFRPAVISILRDTWIGELPVTAAMVMLAASLAGPVSTLRRALPGLATMGAS